jgi:superkiller protein 3
MNLIEKAKRIFLSIVFMCFSLMLFRPFTVNQLMRRGDGYLGYNMYKDAVREYKKALILSPYNTNIMNWLGYTYQNMGEMEKSISIYKRAIDADPQNIIAYNDLGMIYAKDKKFKAAKGYFLRASSIPQNKEKQSDQEYIFYHLGSLSMLSICQEKLGELDAAIKINEKILECYPDNTLSRERLKRLKELRKER